MFIALNRILLTNGISIAYKFLNKDLLNLPLLVFLHEGLGSIDIWKTFPQELADSLHLPALLYDRPGYGDSSDIESFPDNYLENEAFNILPELLLKLNIKNKVIPFGHSDGGTIALLYANKFSNNIICTISEAGHIYFEDFSQKGLKDLVKKYQTGDLKEKLMRLHKDKTDKLFYNWTNIWLSDRLKNWNIIPSLKNITSPILVIQGDSDEYGTNKQVFDIIDNVSTIKEYKIIEKCGHIPHLSNKLEILNLCKNFILKCL